MNLNFLIFTPITADPVHDAGRDALLRRILHHEVHHQQEGPGGIRWQCQASQPSADASGKRMTVLIILCMHKCVGRNDIHIIHNHTRLVYFIWFSIY